MYICICCMRLHPHECTCTGIYTVPYRSPHKTQSKHTLCPISRLNSRLVFAHAYTFLCLRVHCIYCTGIDLRMKTSKYTWCSISRWATYVCTCVYISMRTCTMNTLYTYKSTHEDISRYALCLTSRLMCIRLSA